MDLINWEYKGASVWGQRMVVHPEYVNSHDVALYGYIHTFGRLIAVPCIRK